MRATHITRRIPWIAPLVLFLSFVSFTIVGHAAGPTGEEEALDDYYHGRFASALSPDGGWIVYQDDKNVLHRVRTSDTKANQGVLQLPAHALVISVSDSGQRIAFETDDGCYGVASVGTPQSAGKTPNRLVWVWHNKLDDVRAPCVGVASSSQGSGSSYAIALSSDGRRLALPGSPIRLIDVGAGRVTRTFPTEDEVLGLRFVDHDRKLFVVQAKMGENYEGPSAGSDMQFLVWNLEKNELARFHHTGTTGNLLPYDLLWGFSEPTGQLWAINTNGQDWESRGGQIPAKIRPYVVNVKECSDKKEHELSLLRQDWLDFAADPMGRWVAVVVARRNEKSKQPESRLVLHDSATGAVLAEWDLDSEIHSLTPSLDGDTLYATTSGKVDEIDLEASRFTWKFSGGGQLMSFDVKTKLANIAPQVRLPWTTTTCLIEDELPHARELKVNAQVPRSAFRIHLDTNFNTKRQGVRSIQCSGQETSPGAYQLGTMFGLSNGGRVWVDRWSTLEQIDIRNGRVLNVLSTPRSAKVCSMPIYKTEQFVSWQGDTVTLRPFTDAHGLEHRTVLVTKPGWAARAVVWRPNTFVVWWTRKHPDGNVATLYDKGTHEELKEIVLQEGMDDGTEQFTQFAYQDSDNKGRASSVASSEYEWEASYMHSTRARVRDPSSKNVRTVLWDGLEPGFAVAPNNIYQSPEEARSLGGSLGMSVHKGQLSVYDAATRVRLARLPVPYVQRVRWHAPERTLLVETYGPATADSKGDAVRVLQAFRID